MYNDIYESIHPETHPESEPHHGRGRIAISRIFTEASDAQIAAFLTAMKMKGETPAEIAGLARGMKKAANIINPKVNGTLIDTCGTGGDSTGTINVSTGAAIVTAGAGVAVAKHGNYSITSKSGSADVLKELGVKIDASPEQVERTIEKLASVHACPVISPFYETRGADQARYRFSDSIQYPWTTYKSRECKSAGDRRI